MNNSIGFGGEFNIGPVVGGITYLGGSTVTNVPAEVLYSFGLLNGTSFGNSLIEIDEHTIAVKQTDGSYAVTSYSEAAFVHGGAQLSVGVGVSGVVTLFNGTPSDYEGPFVTFGVQAILGFSVSYVPDQHSLIPASVNILAGPQVKVQFPFNAQKYTRLGDGGDLNVEASAAAEMGAFIGRQGGQPTECFPADTPIQLASGEFTPIASIRSGDQIAAFNGKNFRGRGELELRSYGDRVTVELR